MWDWSGEEEEEVGREVMGLKREDTESCIYDAWVTGWCLHRVGLK